MRREPGPGVVGSLKVLGGLALVAGVPRLVIELLGDASPWVVITATVLTAFVLGRLWVRLGARAIPLRYRAEAVTFLPWAVLFGVGMQCLLWIPWMDGSPESLATARSSLAFLSWIPACAGAFGAVSGAKADAEAKQAQVEGVESYGAA